MKKIALLILSITFLSCSKNESDSQTALVNPSNSTTTEYYSYFRGTLGGNAIDFYITDPNSPTSPCSPGSYHGSHNAPGNTLFAYGHDFESSLVVNPISANGKIIGISFNDLITNSSWSSVSESEFRNGFSSLPTIFTNSTGSPFVNVVYKPNGNAGNVYDSKSGSQAHSTIAYNSIVAGVDSFGTKMYTITGTVSCKLYNTTNTTDVLFLSNSQFKLIYKLP